MNENIIKQKFFLIACGIDGCFVCDSQIGSDPESSVFCITCGNNLSSTSTYLLNGDCLTECGNYYYEDISDNKCKCKIFNP
jgi:hypothetical protein